MTTRIMLHLATVTNNYPIYVITETISTNGTIAPGLRSNVALGEATTSSSIVLPGTGEEDIDAEDNNVGIAP